MTRFATIVAVAAAAAATLDAASAFAPAAAPGRPTTAAQLVPDQGRQLVAFSQEYLTRKAQESATRKAHLTASKRRGTGPGTLVSAARDLASRLLGDARAEDEDEVVYPIVGFELVDGRAVPKPGQWAACSLPPPGPGAEETYGKWTSASA